MTDAGMSAAIVGDRGWFLRSLGAFQAAKVMWRAERKLTRIDAAMGACIWWSDTARAELNLLGGLGSAW